MDNAAYFYAVWNSRKEKQDMLFLWKTIWNMAKEQSEKWEKTLAEYEKVFKIPYK